MSYKNPLRFISAAIGTVAVGLLLMNCYTVVQDGTAKTGRLFGELKPTVYSAGLHFTNPLVDFTTFDIKEQMLVLDNVGIPSQDKFTSTADVSIQWSIDATKLPTLQATIGTQSAIESKLLMEPVMSYIREAGRNVTIAQDLFLATTQEQLQTSVMQNLSANASKYGITIHAVFIKDIKLPAVINDAIQTTKRLEEQVAQEQANLDKQALVFQRQVEEAKAAASSAEQTEKKRQSLANAAAYEIRTAADAGLYAAQQESEANRSLAASVTPNLVRLKELEIDMQKAKSWQGGVPHTVMGDSKAQPLYHMNMSGK